MQTIETRRHSMPVYQPLTDIELGFDRSKLTGGALFLVRSRVGEAPGFEILNLDQHTGALWATKSLEAAIIKGHIDTSTVHRILDFGACKGGPTFALTHAARQIGASVEAIEPGKTADEIVSSDILPASAVHRMDGFSFLESDENKEVYDLITAFLLAKELRGNITRFAKAAEKALNGGGNLLITSDGATLAVVKDTFARSGVEPKIITEMEIDGNVVVPETLVVSKADLSQL